MRTARLLAVSCSAHGGSAQSPPPDADPPGCRPPLDADPPGHVTCGACWEAPPPARTEGMTHACENITLLQTSFAGGNYIAS